MSATGTATTVFPGKIKASECANPNFYEYCIPLGSNYLCVTEPFDSPPQALGPLPENVQADSAWKCGHLHNAFPRPSPTDPDFALAQELYDFWTNHFHLCTPSTEEKVDIGQNITLYIDQEMTCPPLKDKWTDFWDSPAS